MRRGGRRRRPTQPWHGAIRSGRSTACRWHIRICTGREGLRTTFGSRVFEQFVPDHDALIVERLRAAGAITVGKTNTPEFGAGSHTFNAVFGATRNPYDRTKTCGGSSGGAAAALAAGLVPIADGSDLGGSLRNPASFCNVVGFRPSAGRVPIWPTQAAWFPMGVQGPMARTVEDVALMLSAMAGPDPRAPISLPEAGDRFRPPLGRDALAGGVTLAWSRRLAGLPFDPRVTAVVDAQRGAFERIGCRIEDAERISGVRRSVSPSGARGTSSSATARCLTTTATR